MDRFDERWDRQQKQFTRRFGMMAIIVVVLNIAIIVGIFALVAWVGQLMGLW